MSRVMLLLEIMLSGDNGEEEVAAGGEASSGQCQFEKLVFSRKTLLRKQGLILVSLCIWYLDLLGLVKYRALT